MLTTLAQTTTTEQTNTADLSRVGSGGQESQVTAGAAPTAATPTGTTQERHGALGGVVSTHQAALPIGHDEIPRIGLSAVVMEGDDEHTLRVAVGHLPDTPLPWQDGNAALAGHRDTFFRPIRRRRTGDEIRLVTTRGTFRYRATRQVVVGPDELWVLDPSPTVALTLITCYPFDFIGAAPRRFVVHAERIAETSEARPLRKRPREDGVR